MKFHYALLIISAALILTSCDAVVTSQHIAKQTESLIQKELTGAWQSEDSFFQIEFDEVDAGHIASLAWKNNQFKMSRAVFQGLKVNGTTILTLESPDEAENDFLLAAFRLADENTGNAFPPKVKAVAKLVEAGKFEGKVERGKHSITVTVPDAAKMVTSTPLEELFDFDKPLMIRRIKPLDQNE